VWLLAWQEVRYWNNEQDRMKNATLGGYAVTFRAPERPLLKAPGGK
jgi:hypothetical protein